MNINQRITLEEKQRVDKFTSQLIKLGSVLNIVLRVVLFALTAIFFIKSILFVGFSILDLNAQIF